jgi:UDP-GlcNAc:undecaprenyl-phosphate/decaprenyl-phosphate GlcNAc-1-phosphate transferase
VNLSFTPIKKVFMGDAGSIPLGFVIAWLCIDFSQGPGRSLHPVMALWTLVIPIFDVVGVSVVRLKSRRSPFLGDRLHIHHLLPQLLGISEKATLGLLLTLNLILGIIGILVANLYVEVSLLIYIALLCVSMILHVYGGSVVQDRSAYGDR